jgi:hypothetical protein
MKRILIALLLVILPSVALAQSTANYYPVGTCMQAPGGSGFYQQLSDGTWAPPNDRLNTCQMNGFNQTNIPGWSTLPNQYQYNPTLGQMTPQQWYINCVLTQSLFPRPECQGFNPLLGGLSNQTGWLGGLLNYPQFGRDYLSISNSNSSLYVDLTQSENKWKDILLGVGMGWLLNRLTS